MAVTLQSTLSGLIILFLSDDVMFNIAIFVDAFQAQTSRPVSIEACIQRALTLPCV
jgi:hypothetical protein